MISCFRCIYTKGKRFKTIVETAFQFRRRYVKSSLNLPISFILFAVTSGDIIWAWQ